MFGPWLLLVVLILPFAGSLAAAFLPPRARPAAAPTAGGVSVGALAIVVAP